MSSDGRGDDDDSPTDHAVAAMHCRSATNGEQASVFYDNDVFSDYQSVDDETEEETPRAKSVTVVESRDDVAPLPKIRPNVHRGSKAFARLVTFMRPLRKSLSSSLQLRSRTTSTDVVTLQQFTEALLCRTELLPKKIYKVLRDDVEEVTKEALVEATQRGLDRSVRFSFDVYDLDGDGVINAADYRAALAACLDENGVEMARPLFDRAVEAAIAALGYGGEIPFANFQRCVENVGTSNREDLERSPLIVVPSGTYSATKRRWGRLVKYGAKLRYRVLNNFQKVALWTATSLICFGCFYWRFAMYADSPKRRLMSWSLPVAKGMGQVMKFCFSVILFPVSRNAVTWLRTTWLSAVLPFDDAIAYHKFVGTLGFVAATVHTLCHVVDVLNWSDPDRGALYQKAFPDTTQPSLADLCAEQVAVTGLLLYILMCTAYLFALDYPRRWPRIERTRIGKVLNNFNNFWYTHHLFAAFYLLLLIHPTPGIPDESREWGVSDFWVWGGLPISVYLLERGIRVYRQGSWQTKILHSCAISDDTVTIYLSKPRRFTAKAGMYVFLNCPEIAKFEWHPYTMTSAPQDDHIRVHIASLGDWSSAMYSRFKRPVKGLMFSTPWGTDDGASLEQSIRSHFDEEEPFQGQSYFAKTSMLESSQVVLFSGEETARIFVDGPYGAPCQEFDQFSTLMLIGAGIGVTPFASIIRDILSRFDEHRCLHCGKVSLGKSFRLKKVYFIWVVRDLHRALWFNKELHSLQRDDQHGILDIQIFVTGLHPANDLRSKLLHVTQQLLFEKCEVDVLTGMRSCSLTQFGRPNWPSVFERVRLAHPQTTVGVFFCGQYVLSQLLEKTCRQYSDKKDGTKFEYLYERF